MMSLPEATGWLPATCRGVAQYGPGVLIQSTLLLAVGLLAGRALRRSGPVLPCLAYRATLAGALLCALVSLGPARHLTPRWTLALDPASGVSPTAPAPRVAFPPAAPPSAALPLTLTAPPAVRDARGLPVRVDVRPALPAQGGAGWPAPPFHSFLRTERPTAASRWARFDEALFVLWAGGTACLLTWLLLCYVWVARLCRRTAPVEEGEVVSVLQGLCAARRVRPPRLRTSAQVRGVFVTGPWRPTVLLPATYASDFDGATLRAVLAHEVAHLAARDPLWTLLSRLLCAALWPQPLLWALCRRWEEASEEVCDLAAVSQGASRRAYAECLLRVAERMIPGRPERVAGIGIATDRSSLGRRVQRVLSHPSAHPVPRWAPAAVVLAAAAMAVLTPLLVSAAPAGDGWASDARLDRRVAITAEGVPLGELLPLLSQKTGVPLEARRYAADEKVVVFGPARPLRDVLDDLAALYGGYWTSETEAGKQRYVLARSLRVRQYEDRLAGAGDARLLAQLDAQVTALAESPDQLARRPANDPIRQALSSPDGRTATSIYALLPPDQRARLIETWRAKLPVSALNGAQKAAVESLFFGDRFKPIPELGGATITEIPRDQMDQHDLTFSILGGGGTDIPGSAMTVTLSAPSGFDMPLTTFHADAKFLLPPHGDPYTGAPAPPAGLPDPGAVGAVRADAWPDRLRALSEKTGQPVLADYYRSKPISIAARGDESVEPGTPTGALDAFCRPQGYLWWARGGTLLLRKRDWYVQRLYEVPDSWMRAVARRLRAQNGMPTVRDVLSLQDLTVTQLVGLNESLGGHTDRRLQNGLRELLAAAAAAPGDKSAPLPTDIYRSPEETRRLAVLPDLSDIHQQALMRAFLTEHPPAADTDLREFGFLFQGTKPAPGAAAARVDIAFYQGRSIGAGYFGLLLPLTLPDDRVDKTRIEIRT